MTKYPCVYILASKPRGVLYIWVTGNLVKRWFEHQNNIFESFTKKYHVHGLSISKIMKLLKKHLKGNQIWKHGKGIGK